MTGYSQNRIFILNFLPSSLRALFSVSLLDMGSSEFFEHDLFHLAVKLLRRVPKDWYDQEANSQLSKWIERLYQNKELIKSIKFEALELVLFYLTHENSFLLVHYSKLLEAIYSGKNTPLECLPTEYKDVIVNDIRSAAYWLSKIPGVTKDVSSLEFTEQIEKANESVKSNNLAKLTNNKKFTVYKPKLPADVEKFRKACFLHKEQLHKAGIKMAKLHLFLHAYDEKRQIYRDDKPYFFRTPLDHFSGEFKKEAAFIKGMIRMPGSSLKEKLINACKTMKQ